MIPASRIILMMMLLIASLSNLFTANANAENAVVEIFVIKPMNIKAKSSFTSVTSGIGMSSILSRKRQHKPPTIKKNIEIKKFPTKTELKYTLTCFKSFCSRLMVMNLADMEFNAVVKIPAYMIKLLDKEKKPYDSFPKAETIYGVRKNVIPTPESALKKLEIRFIRKRFLSILKLKYFLPTFILLNPFFNYLIELHKKIDQNSGIPF